MDRNKIRPDGILSCTIGKCDIYMRTSDCMFHCATAKSFTSVRSLSLHVVPETRVTLSHTKLYADDIFVDGVLCEDNKARVTSQSSLCELLIPAVSRECECVNKYVGPRTNTLKKTKLIDSLLRNSRLMIKTIVRNIMSHTLSVDVEVVRLVCHV